MNKMLEALYSCMHSYGKRKEELSANRNPWAGLSSYEDPINNSDPLKFCGRNEESLEVFNLIDDNIIITLYGKSGIGKTSLLKAGVFPILRNNYYYPQYVRLEGVSNENQPFAFQITDILTDGFLKMYGKDSIEIIDVIPDNTLPESEEYLWTFFARRRLLTTRVIPFSQS